MMEILATVTGEKVLIESIEMMRPYIERVNV
jgi:hypothetical protein